jgi:hypothetical protein
MCADAMAQAQFLFACASMRWFVIVALGVAACSSDAEDKAGSDAVRIEADRERLGARAVDQANDPGDEILAVPSSFHGVTTWTAYLGSGITVIGTDDHGERQAVVSMLMDANEVEAIWCSTRRTSVEDCSSIRDALAKDLQPAGEGVSPRSFGSVHVLDVASDVRACSIAIGTSLGLLRAQSQDWLSFSPNFEFSCNPTDRPVLMAQPGQCWLGATTWRCDRIAVAARGSPAAACCGVQSRPRMDEVAGSLITGRVKLLCGGS